MFDVTGLSTLDWIASVAIVVGALMSLLAGIAVLRFPDTMSRIHAATKPQVLGIMLLMLGVGLRLQSPAVIGVLVLIVMLQFVTAPVSAHLTVRSAYRNSVDSYRNSVDEGTVDAVETLDDGAAPVDGDRMPEKGTAEPRVAG